MPYDVGCALFKNPEQQFKTFSERPNYYGMTKDIPPPVRRSGLRAQQKLQSPQDMDGHQGARSSQNSALIEQNIDQAQYLAQLVEQNPSLELMAPAPLNTVCFRYTDPHLHGQALDELNHNLIMRLMFSGAGASSETNIKDRKVMSACITNHRTTRKDLERLVEPAAQMGAMMAAELKKC